MIPEDHTNRDIRPANEQDEPPVPPTETTAAQQDGPPLGAPMIPPAMVSTPPGDRLVPRRQEVPPVERWQIGLGLGLAVLGGLSWLIFGYGIVNGNLLVLLLAALPALTCLAAGWLMRSWWGIVAASLVYIAVSAPLWHALSIGAPATTPDFALYVVLPAVVMSLIGTTIGRSRARRAELPPPHGHLAT